MRSNNDELENLMNETFPDGIEAELQRREDQKQHDEDYNNLMLTQVPPTPKGRSLNDVFFAFDLSDGPVPLVEQTEPGGLSAEQVKGLLEFLAGLTYSKNKSEIDAIRRFIYLLQVDTPPKSE